jgi:hypothetical protein
VPRGDYGRPPGVGPALDTPALRDQDNLIWQLSHLPMQPVSVLFAGPSSASGTGQARSFIARVRAPMRVSMTELATGNWPLARVLDWVGAVIAAHAHSPAAQ